MEKKTQIQIHVERAFAFRFKEFQFYVGDQNVPLHAANFLQNRGHMSHEKTVPIVCLVGFAFLAVECSHPLTCTHNYLRRFLLGFASLVSVVVLRTDWWTAHLAGCFPPVATD